MAETTFDILGSILIAFILFWIAFQIWHGKL